MLSEKSKKYYHPFLLVEIKNGCKHTWEKTLVM